MIFCDILCECAYVLVRSPKSNFFCWFVLYIRSSYDHLRRFTCTAISHTRSRMCICVIVAFVLTVSPHIHKTSWKTDKNIVYCVVHAMKKWSKKKKTIYEICFSVDGFVWSGKEYKNKGAAVTHTTSTLENYLIVCAV